MLDLYLETLDVYREEKKISVLESELKRNEINEGEVVVFNSKGELLKSGALVNPMQLILEHCKTDIEKTESVYCADTDFFEVTIIINNEEKLTIKIKNSIAGVNLSCRKILDISYLSELRNLKELILGTCGIEDVSVLGNLEKLERLSLFGNKKIKNFNVFEYLQNLKFLDVSFMNSKLDFSKIGYLNRLEELVISDNTAKIDLSFLQNLIYLKKLNMDYCKNITDISAFEYLMMLEELRMNDIKKITDYNPIGKLMHLKRIVMNKAANLEDISFLHNLKELEYVELFGNKKIKDFSPIEHVKEVVR